MSELTLLLISGTIGFLGTCGGVAVSWRMLKPNQQKVIAEAGKVKEEAHAIARSAASEEAERMLARYAQIVAEQDSHIVRCENKVIALEDREEDCERRSAAQELRIQHLEEVLRRHHLNGD